MRCPRCDQEGMVLESRPRPDNAKRRRYQCANGHRFSTLEQIAERNEQTSGQRLQPATTERS